LNFTRQLYEFDYGINKPEYLPETTVWMYIFMWLNVSALFCRLTTASENTQARIGSIFVHINVNLSHLYFVNEESIMRAKYYLNLCMYGIS